ncbi:amidase [Liquorilactobacillus oeni]|uniref:Amidase n=1 Tax=Liquorilactobacillus oeni DSM 19972 TaxID=1423777 RepID=A0A0R1MI89_9LACO|nr:amidase [Liquorilactobacillus oeni]KRL05636.1 amidase [Liquorilactobacillus oeni DSM 19972]
MAIDALGQAKLVKEGKISSRELVEESLQKIEQLNPKLNAVINRRSKAALKEAQNVDITAPFAGVPLLLKGLGQSLAGEPATAGAQLLKNNRARQTDNFVRSLQQAGFIIIGQTNTPEFGFKNVTDPVLYGPTRNPWNTEYSPGGSSGGAASALASGMVTLAAGSDGGGSIRIPASFSGLIGLKPTRGRIPVGPGSWRGWQGAAINFALTRSIRDTAALLDALQVVQPAAPFQTPLFTKGFLHESTLPLANNFRIGYTTTSPVGTPVSPDAKNAVMEAVAFLRQEGIAVKKVKNPLDGQKLMRGYYIINAGETASMFAEMESSSGKEIKISDVELVTWVIHQAGLSLDAVDYSQTLSQWDQASYEADKMYDDYNLYLTPTTATTAPKINQALISAELIAKMKKATQLDKKERLQLVYDFFESSLELTPFTQQANITGQPAISLPTYVSHEGLPLGIQFIARKGAESTLLQIGNLFEKNGKFKMLRK